MRSGKATAPALFALGEARRVARGLGATVFGFVTAGDLSPAALDELATVLGRAGADRVLCCQHPSLDGPPLDATHGRALHLAAERIPPALFLLPAGSVGAELGPRLAARLNAAYAPAAEVRIDAGTVSLRRWRAAGDGLRRLDPEEVERPIVVTLASARPPVAAGDDADVEMLSLPEPGASPVEELWERPDEAAAVELARGIVLVAPDAGEPVLLALREAAPPGVAVVRDTTSLRPALAAATPSFVLTLGSDARARLTPAGKRGELRPRRAEGASDADVVWTVDDDAAADELASALAAGGAT